jgi:hypothetical protein
MCGHSTNSGANRGDPRIDNGPRTTCVWARGVFSVFARGERRLGHPPGWVPASAGTCHSSKRFICEIAGNGHFVVC